MSGFLIDFDVEKREIEISRGLSLFHQSRDDIQYIDEAALKITAVYFDIMAKHVKPLIPKRVSKFKMASVIALTVVKLQPIKKDKSGNSLSLVNQRRTNAELGFFLAMNLILDMANPSGYEKDFGISFLQEAVKSIKDQHISWLTVKDVKKFPIFPVASFY
jgi:hypothetical protein